jgi:predicted Zn finger-like uncharacterized protein
MLIVYCPQCQAAYQLAANALPASGRKLKCARCGHLWLAQAPHLANTTPTEAPPLPALTVPMPDTSSLATLANAPPWLTSLKSLTSPENRWLTMAYCLAFTGLLGAVAVLVQHLHSQPTPNTSVPAPVASTRPSNQPAIVPEGLIVYGVQVSRSTSPSLLVVRGLVANTTRDAITFPTLQAELLDDANAIADFWPASTSVKTLPGRSAVPFYVSFSTPISTKVRLRWVQ